MKITLWFTQLLLIVTLTKGFAQTELKENIRYEGNTHLTISSLGISLIVPPGFFGGIPSGSPFMVLSDNSNEATIIVTADEMKEESVTRELNQRMSIDEGLSISPVGVVKKEGKRWWGDYKIHDATQDLQCYVEVRLGDFGIGTGCIVLATSSALDRSKKAATELLRSMTFRAPPQKQVAGASGIEQPWGTYLKGMSLKYFYTQGDFSDTDFIHLCSTGTFTRSKSTVSGGSTGTGSMWGGDQGTWQASGQGNEGSLILNNRDGSQTEFKIQYREGTKGLGIYLNGYRYFSEASNQCN